jgi:nucleotidyltransferase substrate binding protein (TIGR01987 family)
MQNPIDTSFFERCIQALDNALRLMNKSDKDNIEYDVYRSACIKEFEIILEQAGKLIKKCLKPYFHSSLEVDKLYFKDVFRHAAKHALISIAEAERWMKYRDSRNNTAHEYGFGFAEEALLELPQFIEDARQLANVIKNQPSA